MLGNEHNEAIREELLSDNPELRLLLGFIDGRIEAFVQSAIDNRELIPRSEVAEMIRDFNNR